MTDRKELDGQLYEAFNRSRLLSESPIKVTTRAELREELASRATGGIYFTTLQKFGLSKAEKDAGLDHPLLSDRRNIIVIADEAHTSLRLERQRNASKRVVRLKRALWQAVAIARP